MPRPTTFKRSATLAAPRSSTLADALGFTTTNFQEVAHGPTCSAAPEPENHSDDGLSEDEDDSHHRDIMLSRQQDLQTAVAPLSCNVLETSDAASDESVRTRPASAIPTASEVVEPSSTPCATNAKAVASEYTEDDWDRPLGQQAPTTQNNWYEQDYYNQQPLSTSGHHHYVAEVEGEVYPPFSSEEEGDLYNPDCDCEECIAMFQERFQHDAELWSFGKRAQEQQYNQMMRLRQEQQARSRRHAASFVTHQQHHHHEHTERAPIKHEEQRKAMLAIHPRGAKGGNPNSTVACCYFKQHGYCKMGPDCWYSHDLDESAPCHYGEKCKAGHANLAKKSSSIQQKGMKKGSTASAIQNTLPSQPSALVPSDEPCQFCGAFAVMTQRFPVFNGNSRSMGTRAHCTQCLNTYSF